MRPFVISIFLLGTFLACEASSKAQDSAIDAPVSTEQPADSATIPESVEVTPKADDDEIAERLIRILRATNWYLQPEVSVDEGVVFLRGRAQSERERAWAGTLAGNTRDVVAVVNRMQVIERSIWDLTPAWREVEGLAARGYRALPLVMLGLLILGLTWLAAGWSMTAAKALLRRRVANTLLQEVAARAVTIPVFLLGLYVLLKVVGLTRLAATVLGGTGLIGLVLGFAFRDIVENFLASILISMQHPFAEGDLIEVSGCKGYVHSVNTRSTLLMTLDGNHLQIPNATIYKETITNFTANPFMRLQFIVGIGYENSIQEAQTVALEVLRNHPAVVRDPESLILVDSLGSATVNLSSLFWVDTRIHSEFKVKSAVTRLTKQAFERAGISMPDEAREIVFPDGVPVQVFKSEERSPGISRPSADQTDNESEVSSAEGDLKSESSTIRQQADQARLPEGGQNLL